MTKPGERTDGKQRSGPSAVPIAAPELPYLPHDPREHSRLTAVLVAPVVPEHSEPNAPCTRLRGQIRGHQEPGGEPR